jgi:hypothetical protein
MMHRSILLHGMAGIFFLSHTLATAETTSRTDTSSKIPIYRCVPQFPLEYSSEDNPDDITDLQLTIWEDKSDIVAGRPQVRLKGTFKDHSGQENSFSMALVGIPEFLGTNMFHAYFIGAPKPKQFSLTSGFSMSGASRAYVRIDRPIGPKIKLDTPLSCDVLADSIYLQ